MVSPLSARLLSNAGGYNSSETSGSQQRDNSINNNDVGNNTGNSHNKTPRTNWKSLPTYPTQPSTSDAGSSGYLADFEQKKRPFTAPPTSIDARGTTGTKRLSQVGSIESAPKRQKPSSVELMYMAGRAKKDLERGGMRYPKIQTKRSRILPLYGKKIDMSSVQLVHSKKVAKSPFLYDYPSLVSSDCPLQIPDMVQAVSFLYRDTGDQDALPASFEKIVADIRQKQQHQNERMQSASSDSDSTTSSFTSSDETDGISTSTGGQASPVPTPKSASPAFSCAKATSSVVSIAEALSISFEPRVITLSTAPFKVVQANAAFHRLVGSSDFVGKPVSELVNNKADLVETLQDVGGSAHQKELDNMSLIGSKSSSTQQQAATISPVGPSSNAITHFSIEIQSSSNNNGVATAVEFTNVPMSVTG